MHVPVVVLWTHRRSGWRCSCSSAADANSSGPSAAAMLVVHQDRDHHIRHCPCIFSVMLPNCPELTHTSICLDMQFKKSFRKGMYHDSQPRRLRARRSENRMK